MLAGFFASCAHPVPPPSPPLEPVPQAARYHYLVAMRALTLDDVVGAEAALGVAMLYDRGAPDLWMAMADISAREVSDPRQEVSRASRALDGGRGRGEVWARLGEAQLRAGEGDAARQSFEAAVLRGAGDEAWARLTELLWEQDRAAAKERLGMWTLRVMEDPVLLARRGHLRLLSGDLRGAAADLGGAVGVSAPGLDPARVVEDWTLAVTGSRSYRSALGRLGGAAGEAYPRLRLKFALRARDPVRAEAALAHQEAATGLCDGGAWGELAGFWAELGRSTASATALTEARRCRDPELARHRALVLAALGQPGAALKALEAGADADPVWRLRGTLYLELGRTREALRAFHRCDPDHPEVRAGLARGYAALQDVEPVEGYAAEAGPEEGVEWLLLAGAPQLAAARVAEPQSAAEWRAGARLRQGEARITWVQEGLQRFPDDAGLWVVLAEARSAATELTQGGADEPAQAAWIAALLRDPRHPAASRWLSGRVLARDTGAAFREAAGPWLRDALEAEPARVDLLHALGEIAMAAGRPGEAEVWWAEAQAYRGGAEINARR